MSNKQQTAVELLVDQLEKHYVFQDIKNTTAFLQAREMEKAEKIKFATDFFFWWYNQTSGTNTYEAVEKFYKETYGGNK
jgi:trehalose utilization protein